MSAVIIKFPVTNKRQAQFVEAVERITATPNSINATVSSDSVSVSSVNASVSTDNALTSDTVDATTFQVGLIYWTRSACDYDTIYQFKVLKRTAKRVTLVDEYGKEVVRGVSFYNGIEQCSPHGKYSMSAIISADKYSMEWK